MVNEDTNKSVDEILEDRGVVYGDFPGNLQLREDIMLSIDDRYYSVNGNRLSNKQRHLFQDVIAKLARLAATPDHIDSWKDLAGYSTLVCNMIKEQSNEK